MNLSGANTSRRGFTIVELLIVIVVIAILAVITIVAFNGVTKRANDAAFYSNVDAYEKGIRLAVADGFKPAAHNETIQPQTTNPNPSYPGYTEWNTRNCLPGNYPATELFREGECSVNVGTFKPDGSNGVIPLYRSSSSTSTQVPAALSPSYMQTLPRFNQDVGYKYSSGEKQTVAEMHANGYSWIQQEGFMSTYAAIRGAIVQASPSVTFIQYYREGDTSCGRGTKSHSPGYSIDAARSAEFAAMSDEELVQAYAALINISVQDAIDMFDGSLSGAATFLRDSFVHMASRGAYSSVSAMTLCSVRVQ